MSLNLANNENKKMSYSYNLLHW